MNYALFLGCTTPVRARNYEMSVRLVAARLGIQLVDLSGFSCCGFPVKSIDRAFSEAICGRNLALAEQRGLDICVLCSACSAMLAEVNHIFRTYPEYLERANRHLGKIGLSYNGTVEVKHISRILYTEIGIERIQNSIVNDLREFVFAIHYGCHYLKPSDAHGMFDSVESPITLDELVRATGASTTNLQNRKYCCGGAVLAVDRDITYQMAEQTLQSTKIEQADAICLICPFCGVIYDDNQKSIELLKATTFDIPVLYYPQILGLAMGMDPAELGLKLNKIKTGKFLEKLGHGLAGKSNN